jgi:acyl-CoA hydrolase
LGKDAKSGTSRETATQIGSALTKHKMGEMDKDKMDIYLMPMDVSNGNQNAGTRTEEETDKLETKKGASLQST